MLCGAVAVVAAIGASSSGPNDFGSLERKLRQAAEAAAAEGTVSRNTGAQPAGRLLQLHERASDTPALHHTAFGTRVGEVLGELPATKRAERRNSDAPAISKRHKCEVPPAEAGSRSGGDTHTSRPSSDTTISTAASGARVEASSTATRATKYSKERGTGLPSFSLSFSLLLFFTSLSLGLAALEVSG
jgi:hypothetical protein